MSRASAPGHHDAQAPSGSSPEELARLAQQGSLVAFSHLVEQFEGRLFSFILRRVGNASDAEELTQETFVRAWERIERYDSRWRFSTWLFTIGLRLAVSAHRSRSRLQFIPLRPGVVAHEPAELPADVSDRELGAPTWDLARETLTEAQHTALWLRYAEGLSMEEIAQVMGKTQVSVRVTLFRARDSLARRIDACRQHGIDEGLSELSARALAAALFAAGVEGT